MGAVVVVSGTGLVMVVSGVGDGGGGGWLLCISSRDVAVEPCSIPVTLPCSADAELDDVGVCEDCW